MLQKCLDILKLELFGIWIHMLEANFHGNRANNLRNLSHSTGGSFFLFQNVWKIENSFIQQSDIPANFFLNFGVWFQIWIQKLRFWSRQHFWNLDWLHYWLTPSCFKKHNTSWCSNCNNSELLVCSRVLVGHGLWRSDSAIGEEQ
jgi:hypothetical protein